MIQSNFFQFKIREVAKSKRDDKKLMTYRMFHIPETLLDSKFTISAKGDNNLTLIEINLIKDGKSFKKLPLWVPDRLIEPFKQRPKHPITSIFL